MNITVQRGTFKTIVFEDTNVKVEVVSTEGLYALKEDGKKDYSKRLGEDITDDALKMLSSPLEDLFYYRDREFDSTELIKQAFDKLPDDKMTELLKYLNENYDSVL